MNRCNDWQNLLTIANEDLGQFGYSILLTKDKWDCWFCEICMDGEAENEDYAGNYYEDELSDLIMDAWHYVKLKLV